MTDRLQAIKDRLSKATPGPWRLEFLAHAPEDIAWLIAEVERLNNQNADIQRYCEENYNRAREAEREQDALRNMLLDNPICQNCVYEDTCESSNSCGCSDGLFELRDWRGVQEVE